MRSGPSRAHGFTLVELMIVVAIVGILAAIALQDFIVMQCRAKQAEVRPNLRAMLTMQEQHRAENDRYGCVNDPACPPEDVILFEPKGTLRYRYFSSPTGTQTFYGEGEGLADPLLGDLWMITEQNDVSPLNNMCD